MTIIHVFVQVCLFLPFGIKVYFMHSHIIFFLLYCLKTIFLLYHMWLQKFYRLSESLITRSYTAKLMHYYLTLFQEEQGNANTVCIGSCIEEQRNTHSKSIKILLVLLVCCRLNQEVNAFRSDFFFKHNFHKCMLYSAVVILKFSQCP